jgi:signal transduction histidine kinase
MIWLAYVSIPLALVYFARHQGRRIVTRLVLLFAAFILCCGTTHFIEALMFDYPLYRLAGVVKFITAAVSWVTVMALIPAMPGLIRTFSQSLEPSAEMPALAGLESSEDGSAAPVPRWRSFAVALAAAGAAVLVRWVFHPLMSADHAFVIPLLAVVFVAWHSGFWPAILCLNASMVAVVYLFIEPRHTFIVERLSDQVAVGLFFFAGVGCSLLGQAQITNSRRAARHLAISRAKQQELAIVADQLKESQRETTDTLNALIRSERMLQQSHLELEQRVALRTHELSEVVEALQKEVETRTRAEKQVEAAAEELRRSNSDLEQFAYVASHDMQEPLRKIQAFGDRLRLKCGAQLDGTGQDYLQRMLSAAGRMRQLIQDLLNLSRVSSKPMEFQPTDLGAVVQGVLSDLEERIERTGGSVEVGRMATIQGDPSQLRQLFQNLLGNALKFHRPGVPPRVRVSAELLAEEKPLCRIVVADNGIGFDEKYAARIFQVFQRLHGRDEYEGTGVGLAICHKIVQRHGGEIRVRSRVGEGSEFTIALPVHPQPTPAP